MHLYGVALDAAVTKKLGLVRSLISYTKLSTGALTKNLVVLFGTGVLVV